MEKVKFLFVKLKDFISDITYTKRRCRRELEKALNKHDAEWRFNLAEWWHENSGRIIGLSLAAGISILMIVAVVNLPAYIEWLTTL